MRFVELVALAIALAAQLAGCGPDPLFVNGQVGLDDDCKVRADDEHAVELPVFDIARGGAEGSDSCEDPFVAQLWIENENSERARVTEAEIRLSTLGGDTLRFDQEATPLPNPFLLNTAGPVPADGSGVIEVEVVPRAYAEFLTDFTGEKIAATIVLHGETAGGGELESSSFTVPISICDGCRTLCASDPEAEGATCSAPELGPLRTFCVDPEC
jgi:hypothetical protein